MHEFSVATYLVDSLESLAQEKGLSEISNVTLELGEVSSVLPDYLRDAWDYVHKRSEVMKDAELIIEMQPAVTICNGCGETYKTVEYGRTCPHCGSERTELVTGNQCIIKQVTAR